MPYLHFYVLGIEITTKHLKYKYGRNTKLQAIYIKETAKTTGVVEYYVRQLVAKNEICFVKEVYIYYPST